jgi:tripartite-type tricarboxylate transporter receptor subunit TctC
MARTAGKIRALALAAAGIAVVAAPTHAQSPQGQTTRLVVAYSPGGTGDVVARILQDKLATALGQNVVVENRTGASGAIGARSVVTAPPDGRTLLVGQTGEAAINQHFMKDPGYDPDKDLVPVALAGVVPLALVVPAKAPYASMADFAKALPGAKLTFASAGAGTPGYFAGEVLKARMKADLTHVPYKGAAPALNDLIGGHVDLYFPGMPAVIPHLKSGLLKVLAVSSVKRSAIAPDVPTVAEASPIKDFDFTLWVSFLAPARTPSDVVARLNTAINTIITEPETRAKLIEAGADVTPMSVDQITAFVRSESGKYQKIIKELGVTGE